MHPWARIWDLDVRNHKLWEMAGQGEGPRGLSADTQQDGCYGAPGHWALQMLCRPEGLKS